MMDKKIVIPFLIAILLRLYPFNFYGFQGSDPYIHLSVANYFEKYGFNRNYPLSNYPTSSIIREPLGLYLAPIFIHHLIPSGIVTVFQIMPIIFGLFSILFSYLLFREIIGNRAALITTVLLSLSIANMTRTGFGVYRGEMLMLPFFLASIFLLVRALRIDGWKRSQTIEKTLLFSGSGMLLGFCAFFWNGYPFAIITTVFALSFLVLVNIFKNDQDLNPIIGLIIVSLVSLIFVKIWVFSGVLYEEHKFTSQHFIPLFLVLMTALVCMWLIRMKFNIRKPVFLVPLLFLLVLPFVYPGILDVFTGYGMVVPGDPYNMAIQELQQPTFEFLFLTLDITIILALLGAVILILKIMIEPGWKKIFFLAFCIPLIYLSFSALRFIFLGSYAFSALSAYFFSEILKEKKTQKRNTILLLVVFAVMFVHVIQVRSQLEFHTYWEDALLWIKTNAGLDEGIATWRDDGGIIQAFAERATTVDSVLGQKRDKLEEITNLMLSNTTQNISAEYVVFDKNRVVDLQGIANMMEVPGDFSLIELSITLQGDIVQTYPTNFMINLTSRTANAGGIPLDLIILNGTEFSHYPAPDLRIEGAVLLQSRNAFYLSEQLYQSNFVKMIMLDGIEGYKLVYRDPQISIYEVCSRTGCL